MDLEESATKRTPGWFFVAAAAVAGVMLAIAVNAWLVTVTEVDSESMSPTLVAGERVVVSRLGEVRRGDVVVLDGRGSLVSAAHPPSQFVKRVVGVGGDRVFCCEGGALVVNGLVVAEPYIDEGAADATPFEVLVPPGKLWVMGDLRSHSSDSRAHLGDPGGGFVPVDRVTGRVVAVLWPPTAARILR